MYIDTRHQKLNLFIILTFTPTLGVKKLYSFCGPSLTLQYCILSLSDLWPWMEKKFDFKGRGRPSFLPPGKIGGV